MVLASQLAACMLCTLPSLLLYTTVDVRATGGICMGKTAVQVARERGYTDIVEMVSTHKAQPGGELHTSRLV